MKSIKERALTIWGNPHSVANYYVLFCRNPSFQILTVGLKPSLPRRDEWILNPMVSQP